MAELVSIKRNVDVSPGQAAPAVFHCSQGDVGSKIILGLLNNGTAYSIPSGVTVTIEGSESNGSIFTPISATASGSDITFYLTGEMTAVAGPAICQAVLKSGSNILGTANFTLEVESSPMGADAPPVFTDAGWTWMLNKLTTEFVPALGDNIIDAIDSKADQSDLTTLSNTVAGHTGSITVLNNTVNNLNQSVTENRQNISRKLDKNQGTANAGKYLKVGADGNVETADLDVTTDKTLSIADKAADAKTVGDELTDLKADLTQLTNRVDAIEEEEGLHRYGVSGIGQAASQLTRLWDAVGMTAQVGTDGDNSSVINNFDDVTPFNRRKCVGKWHLENGKAVFHVHAYYEDEDYTEDGTMGDYVAVECPRAYYYLKDGVLGVSAHHYQGWRPFDIFCRNHDPEDTFEYYYMPAYALAEKDGHAVSLSGLDNKQGDYASLVASARTYDGDVNTKAIIQPAAVNFYEWALYTVEFATQNCQSIMQGCSALRHSNDDHAVLRSDGKWLLNNYQAARVVGEYVSIQPTNIDQSNYRYSASHRITSIIRCDENGNASASGTHQLVTTEDLELGRTYDIGGEYRFVARPYRTGSCNGVSTPSGSPVSNNNGYYPCKYRWHENPFGNQFKTVCDLFNVKVGTGDDDYSLEWYYAPDPTVISGNPSQATLDTDAFELLDIATEHENYVNGYIRSKKYSAERPDIWIPYLTTGAAASSYFCDYASLVSSHVVRSVRFAGSWNLGAFDGFSYCYVHDAPSSAFAFFGADLFILQEG